MPTIYRVCKARHPVFDGIGALLFGGRWNSPGQPVIYASTCLAGSILEIIAHAGRRLHLPGTHHGGRAFVPDELRYERLEADGLVGWADEESRSAREYGDAWLGEARTAVLFVPSATARPFGHTVLLNPRHPDYRGSGSSSRGRSPGTRGSSGSDPADRHRPFLRSMALWRSHPASHRVVGRAEQHHAESRSVDSGNRKKNTSSSLPGTRRRVYPEVIHGSRPTPPSVSPLDRRDPE